MGSYIAVEPEYLWKVEPLEDGSKLLSIQTDDQEIRIAWEAGDANKLSTKMRSIEPAPDTGTKGLAGGSSERHSGNGGA